MYKLLGGELLRGGSLDLHQLRGGNICRRPGQHRMYELFCGNLFGIGRGGVMYELPARIDESRGKQERGGLHMQR
jgi:hypothetical protein